MTVAAVLVGGALGAMVRHVARELAAPRGHAARATVLVNVVGAGLLGIVVGGQGPDWPDWVLVGVTAGVLGALTTTSSLALDVVNQARRADRARPAVTYLVVTLALGLGAASTSLL